MVMNESMRLDSTVAYSTPIVLTEDTTIGQYLIKKTTPIFIAIQHLHLAPEEW